MAKRSGIHLQEADIPIVLGMVARDDRDHDIAAWFGVNQGRIAEAKDGKFGTPPIATAKDLPPKGPPGPKGRRLRARARAILQRLDNGDAAGAQKMLNEALAEYDADEN